MADMNNIDIIERDVSSVEYAANDIRKKEDRKCKLTEHSYINVLKKTDDNQKEKVQQDGNEIDGKEESSKNFESQQINSSEVELVQLSELYTRKETTPKVVNYIKSKALRMANSMIDSMVNKYDEIVHFEYENKIDLNEIDFDSIKKAVTDNLAAAELSMEDAIDLPNNELNYENNDIVTNLTDKSTDSYIEHKSWEQENEIVDDNSSEYSTYSNNNITEENVSPIIPAISDYSMYGDSKDELDMINKNNFGSEIEEDYNMEYQSIENSIDKSSSSEDLERLQEQLRTITTKRDRMIKLTEETLMKEANEARELAEAHAQTREAYEMVNNLIEGISQEIDREQEKVSQSQRKIEQYTAEKQREAEKQRVLNEMVGAYSTNAQNVSGIGANFIRVGRTR